MHRSSFAHIISLLWWLLATCPLSSWALKFDLTAHPSGQHKKSERCIRNFVAKDTLVVVTATVGGQKGDGQMVNMHVCSLSILTCIEIQAYFKCIVLRYEVVPFQFQSSYCPANSSRFAQIKDAVGNDYGRPRDVVGESRSAFTSHADAAFDVCFENQLTGRMYCVSTPDVSRLSSQLQLGMLIIRYISVRLDHSGANPLTRHVELDIDIGADAQDWSAIQAAEKLKPVETELRRMEQMVAEIVAEMDYLRTREQKLRDTNESTNERVKWFAFGTMGVLVGLGAWQIIYLRAYFRYGYPTFPNQVTDVGTSC